ncbi:MAG TPA: SGNH/GDSL hydrolase family protein [Oscillatoriaceae cyanobacterium M33_DOE_052]|uniref:SGNH/GDSL hydrolase family protein n=1 Tax=Planktothricoides sp. SpSt-374 TaxID=2282167 RepID=A0A7C3ZUK1_9CYAN|nr:SGNH/GDSL hydrolase family protein [Oscillatoriaceae cyanobacterium M33_DOE_052]
MLTTNDLFDEGFYLAKNPEVGAQIGRGDIESAFDHFQTFGEVEGRDPSAFFDTSYYLETNPDVAAAVSSFDVTAFEHFITAGQFEGRNPSPFFDPDFYRQKNPDVAAVNRDPITGLFAHFLASGAAEGRDPNPLLDTSYYLDANPDVAAGVQQKAFSAFEHFVASGQFERRNPNPLFNTDVYLANNSDIAAGVAQNAFTGFEHFLKFGQFERRNFSPVFDTGFYLDQNPDVALVVRNSGISALEHFIEFGQREGRQPRRLFSEVYVFGDSLSDDGNLFALTNGLIPPSPPYDNGRFTNGSVWVEQLAPKLGLPVNPNTNFAIGGALSGNTNNFNTRFPTLPALPGLQQPLDSFVAANPAADSQGLYVVWAGANDYGQGVTDVAGVVNNLTSAITNLAAVGARNFMVPNLPDLGVTPAGASSPNAAGLSQLSTAHNNALAAAIPVLEQNLNVNVIPVDVNTLINNARSNPAAFGFTNVSNAFLTSGATNPNEFIFWDELHPTFRAHQLIADAANQAITAIAELVQMKL